MLKYKCVTSAHWAESEREGEKVGEKESKNTSEIDLVLPSSCDAN